MSENESQVLLAQILSAYLSNNSVSPADLPSVIVTVKRAFAARDNPSSIEAGSEGAKTYEAAVPVKKSVTPDAITCLCCGKPFKTLKRHLRAEHQMSPADYRTAFNLKADYPLVAPNYAARRAALAKSLGLGHTAGRKSAAKKSSGKPLKKAPKA